MLAKHVPPRNDSTPIPMRVQSRIFPRENLPLIHLAHKSEILLESCQ